MLCDVTQPLFNMHKMSYWFIAIYLTLFAVLLILLLKMVEFEIICQFALNLTYFLGFSKFTGCHFKMAASIGSYCSYSYFLALHNFNRVCGRLHALIRAA